MLIPSLEDLLRENAFEVLYHKFCEFLGLNLYHQVKSDSSLIGNLCTEIQNNINHSLVGSHQTVRGSKEVSYCNFKSFYQLYFLSFHPIKFEILT